jgi:hypothetical protein
MTTIAGKNLPAQGGGAAGPDNFSYKKIFNGNTVTIPVDQVMITPVLIDVEGILEVIGDLFLIDLNDAENFSYDKIESGNRVVIPDGQQMIVDRLVDVDGVLEVNGKLIITEV